MAGLEIKMKKDAIASCYPEAKPDGIILKCRKVRTIGDNFEADGYLFGPDEQVFIMTGIETITVPDGYELEVRPIHEYMANHELTTFPELYRLHDEWAVIIYNHGKRLNMIGGMPAARMILRPKSNINYVVPVQPK